MHSLDHFSWIIFIITKFQYNQTIYIYMSVCVLKGSDWLWFNDNLAIFSSPDPKGQVSYCHHWASVVRPSSVNFSHFNQLLWSHWANLNQTLVEWSLDGPLPKLCPVIPTSNQDGCQAKNRKKGGWNFSFSRCIPIMQIGHILIKDHI